MKTHTALALSMLLAATGACSPPPAEPVVDLAAETAALRAAAEEYHRVASALDADGIAALYTADAVAYPPNEPTVVGRDGFREYAAGFVSAPGIQMSFDNVQVVVGAGADMGYTYAEGHVTLDGPDGEPMEEQLRDFHVWRKDASGAWKVAVDIWNSPTPLPTTGN